jgi:monoamine oxidase
VVPAVIIVGAGAAGLAAARALSLSGVCVLLLEARSRPGGRIRTIHETEFSAPIELGAEFVHGKPPQIWKAVEAGDLRAIEMAGAFRMFRNGRIEQPGAMFHSTEPVMKDIPHAPEQSFAEFVKSQPVDEEARRWSRRYIEGFHAARTDEIGVQGLATANRAEDDIEGDRTFRLEGGYGRLIEWLQKDVKADVRYGVVVKGVAWRRGCVDVRTDSGNFRVPRLICTAPIGVLAARDLRFEPEPENLRSALGGIAMGHAARISLRFRRAVWEDRAELRGLGFLLSEETAMPTWWTTAPSPEPLITGWTGGPAAEALPVDTAAWLDLAFAALAKMLGGDAAALRGELVSWHAHNWTSDPFSRGAYTYVRVGGLEAQQRFHLPVDDTLYFAGEAADTEGYWSTVHGAIASGERAARLILDSMGA